MKRGAGAGGVGTSIARHPHTLTALACGSITLAVVTNAFRSDAGAVRDFSEGVRRGVFGAMGSYVAYSALQGPATHMTRPHAAVWKMAHGTFIVYLMALVVLVFQTPEGAQKLLKFFWSDLGVPLATRSYGGDCRIYVPGHRSGSFGIVYETLFDEFTLAHILGWYGKAIAIRDWKLLWAYSIAFELCELTFEHWQPNFNECWWDMWVWDVLVCNLAGIVAGMATVKFLQGKMYDWSGKASTKAHREPRTVKGAFKRVVMIFTPASVEHYTWRPTDSPARFMKCAFLVFCGLVFDLNLFFMKYVLHVPPSHPFCLGRLAIWFAMSNIAIREYYVFIESDSVSTAKLGPNAWLALAVLVVEILVVVKNGHGKFTNPWPRHVLLAWAIVFVGTTSYLIAWQRRLNQSTSAGKGKGTGKGKKASTIAVKSSSSSAGRSSSRKSKRK